VLPGTANGNACFKHIDCAINWASDGHLRIEFDVSPLREFQGSRRRRVDSFSSL
jgi:hypothetical protein